MKLKIEHILIAFQIVTIKYVTSFFGVLILEIISVKFCRVRYVLDYFTY